ncbi:MAG: hypothetical protein EPN21_04555 [Methylococcaceae bacterium]|nr:MAG: hypothetical protein EPN21_04555 [Methylococcaceae bacterium]
MKAHQSTGGAAGRLPITWGRGAELCSPQRKHIPASKAELIGKLSRKLRGYWGYYGIHGNYEGLGNYFYHVTQILYSWFISTQSTEKLHLGKLHGAFQR